MIDGATGSNSRSWKISVARQLSDGAAREEERREDDYQLSVKMREKAFDILKYPVATMTTSSADGKSTTTVKPGRWSLATVARLAEAASNLSGKAIRNDGASTYSISYPTKAKEDEARKISNFAIPIV